MSNTLEQQLFSWEEWDNPDEGIYVFTNVALKENIGGAQRFHGGHPDDYDYPAGHTFSHAVMNYKDSTVCFYDAPGDEVGHKYELYLSVGAKVP